MGLAGRCGPSSTTAPVESRSLHGCELSSLPWRTRMPPQILVQESQNADIESKVGAFEQPTSPPPTTSQTAAGAMAKLHGQQKTL